MTDEKYEEELNRASEIGKASGWELGSRRLMEEAELHFRNGKDEMAKTFRQWANIFKEEAGKLKEKYCIK